MPNPFFSGRIPKDLDERIKQHINKTGESKTEILINALSVYLNHPVAPRSNSTNEVFKEMFAALEERVAMLEKAFQNTSDNIIIKADNSKQSVEEETQEQVLNSADNKTDTNGDNKDTEPKLGLTNDNFDNKTDNSTDNNQLEVSQAQTLLPRPRQTLVKLENLTSGEMVKAAGLKQSQLDSYRRRIVAKCQKIGLPLEEKELLNPPEKVETKHPITIDGYPYDLFHLGQNEKGKNLWTAIPFDNDCYQQLSINSTQEES